MPRKKSGTQVKRLQKARSKAMDSHVAEIIAKSSGKKGYRMKNRDRRRCKRR